MTEKLTNRQRLIEELETAKIQKLHIWNELCSDEVASAAYANIAKQQYADVCLRIAYLEEAILAMDNGESGIGDQCYVSHYDAALQEVLAHRERLTQEACIHEGLGFFVSACLRLAKEIVLRYDRGA